MSDTEETKKSGYRVEYAASARAKCKGPKPCAGTTLAKGDLRFGSLVDFKGRTSFAWRHWGCVTPKIIENVKKSFEDPQELDGFDELNDEDKEKLKVAWDAGHVADEDIPPTAIKAADEEEEEKPKRRAPKKRKEVEDNDEEEEKPRKARGKKPKATEGDDEEPAPKPKASRARKPKKPVSDAEDVEEEEAEVEEKPKKKAAPRKKPESKAKPEPKAKAPPKAKAEPKPRTKAAPKKAAKKTGRGDR
ncbi:hypothetical protein BJ322DRAFT_643949 [Thelephora terrestris]|uniref:PARP-type domain-containing protein n=1 Tax=Thelephora terrestris TaxID=56493 RepID=A0A9P6L913_9AGAM|nr:hypothetical protein BJ322DRAFT_643949 [Thelephora terrestris]